MTTYYIATADGGASNGYLIANGEVFNARSGGFGRGEVPAGTYSLGGPEGLNKARKQDRSTSPGGRTWRRYRKFYISGVGPGEIRDPRYPGRNRTGVRFHYDGNGPGTEGCIGYDTIDAQHALTRAYEAGDRQVQVIHVANDAEARRRVRELTGQEPPTTDRVARGRGGSELGPQGKKKKRKKKKAKKKAAQRRAETSTIRHGARMAEGERTVLLGQRRLVAAHRTARHTGGGRIARGSRTVFVGRQMLAFGRVEDPTTDGSQVASGEESVMVG